MDTEDIKNKKDRKYVAQNKYKAEHRAIGLCIECSRSAAPGAIRCAHHSHARALSQRRYRQKLKQAGLCIHCQQKLHPDIDKNRVCCIFCREKGGSHQWSFSNGAYRKRIKYT